MIELSLHAIAIIATALVVVGSGALGGGTAYVLEQLQEDSRPSDTRRHHLIFLGSVAGVLATFLLVAFSEVMNSPDIVGNIFNIEPSSPSDWAILIPFCLAAGVASRTFVPAVSDQLIKKYMSKVDDSNSITEALASKLARAELELDKANEALGDLREEANLDGRSEESEKSLSGNAIEVLETLNESKISGSKWQLEEEIAGKNQVEYSAVHGALLELEKVKFAKQKLQHYPF